MNSIIKIFKTTSRFWPYYLIISISSVFIGALGLLMPYFSGQLIDEIRIIDHADIKKIIIFTIFIFLADFGTTIVSNIGGYFGDMVTDKVQWYLSDTYYKHILSLPQSYFNNELSGKIISRMDKSVVQIANFVHVVSNNALQFVFSTVFSLIIISIYSWQVALILLSLYPMYAFLTARTSKRWVVYQNKKNNLHYTAMGRFIESVNQIKVVKSFVQELREIKFFNNEYSKILQITKPQSRLWHKRDVQRRALLNVVFLVVYLLIFLQAANGAFTSGQAVMLILYAMQIRIPIFTISFLVENIQRSIADSKEYFDALETKPDIEDQKDSKDLLVSGAGIEFKDVNFGYSHNLVLKKVAFSVEPGSKVALVGESGEGKTTITNLLLRFYDTRSGSILIDGQDIAKVKQESLRKSIGVVFQEPALFSGTIRENISYYDERTNIEDVVRVAKLANAHEFISKFGKGYDTEIGEKGLKLSGGQKQRIAIARALLKDAPILILDEATSSLDSKSEKAVQSALERLMKGRTTIIIAHRLSTIKDVDRIITLKDGMVDEIGSPVKLASTGGIYSKLLSLQQLSGDKNKKKLRKFDIKE